MQKSQPPISTYRVQLRSGITFERLRSLVDYFQELGISHLYLSPVLKSESTSAHGYAVVDFERIDPRVGTAEELSELARALSERGMGILLDFVPNHTSASPENRWWRDVLELGPRSIYAHFFDVDWNRPEDDLRGRVLAPVLNEPYAVALEKNLDLTRTGDGLCVAYRHQRFPLAPATWTLALGALADDPGLARILSRLRELVDVPPRPLSSEAWHEKERLKEETLSLLDRSEALSARADRGLAEISRSSPDLSSLLSRQAFRLTHFRHAASRINYRRFFDISGLVALRSEDPEVFEATHRATFELLSRSGIEGLRIDHIDGLLDPRGYLEKLPETYVVVEKILERGEALREEWPVSGTTGYETLNRIQRLFVEPKGLKELVGFFEELTGDAARFEDVVYRSKLDALENTFESDVRSIADPLIPLLARMSVPAAAPSGDEVRGAVRALVASFPLYRTYLRPDDARMDERDRRVLATAVSGARRRSANGESALLDRLGSVLALDEPSDLAPADAHIRLQTALRFQQLTGPVMAKGVEDTAFFRYFPLLSLNEVGGGPVCADSALDEFHDSNRERARKWPLALTATSTHDTKRDEDVRARMQVISEVPAEWREAVGRWRVWNRRHKRALAGGEAPDEAAEYHLYQTLVGSWPLQSLSRESRREYVERMRRYMLKAAREAKLRTGWLKPDSEYESALSDFVGRILEPQSSFRFLDDFSRFESRTRRPGLLSALSQLVLKGTMPGVPDFYQGSEIWELRLVDPDNRAPVDFELRRSLLRGVLEEVSEDGEPAFVDRAIQSLEDGKLKLYLTRKLLELRSSHPALVPRGKYERLEAEGSRSESVVAFTRSRSEAYLVVAVGRLFTKLPDPALGSAWEDTVLQGPAIVASGHRDLLTGRSTEARRSPKGGELPLAEVFHHAPFAILEPKASAK